MRIANEEIERLKREVDLVELVRSHGVELKKRGRNWVGLCPFHEEAKPSFTVNPHTNLYHCFGCPPEDNGGNAITFVMKRKGIGFREAFAELAGAKRAAAPATATATPAPRASSKRDDPRARVRLQKLLARVAAYYRRAFETKPAGRDYLAGRGISAAAALEAYGAGLCDGSLHEVAPRDGQVIADLLALGILTESGRELFDGCVVFPLLDEQRATVGMYGRRLCDGEVNHLYLPGERRGLVNRFGVAGTVLLCESVLDALTLSCHGLVALPCFGTQGLGEEHMALLARPQVFEVVLCFDGDEAGRRGAELAAERLRAEGAKVRTVDLPEGEDINSLVARAGIDHVRELLGMPAPVAAAATPATSSTTASSVTVERTPGGLVLCRGGREYEVKSVSKQGTQLRAALKATRPDGQFELSSVDLYSHRSRAWFASLAANLFGVEQEQTRDDLNQVLVEVEAAGREPAEASATPEMSESDREEAGRLLTSTSLLDDVAADLERIGYTGERTNKLICYLAAVSRKLEEPLSVLIQSRSAAGKSALQEAVLSLVPEEEALHYSRLTDQALFYQKEDALVHKLLAIEEAEGIGGAAYSIRAMQSAKRLTVAATGKDPATGKMRTEEYTVRGPVAVMLTTTRTDFDQETMSRFLCLTVDESAAMTQRIHAAQRHRDTLEGMLARRGIERVQRRHHNAQRLLEPVRVANPYAERLQFPYESLRSRRDHMKYLGLIKAITYLHQRQRTVKEVEYEGEQVRYVEVTPEDIALANELMAEVLTHSLSDLTPQAQRLLEVLRQLVRERSNGEVKRCFSRRELREYSRWSDWQVKTHLAELVELEYVHVRQGAKGKEYLYEILTEPEPGCVVLGLTPTAELLERLRQPGGEEGDLEVN